MYPLAPLEAEEFGRNDVGKLGCFWVDVYQEGHVARFLRSGTDNGDGVGADPALGLTSIEFILDGFVDIDRGYYPRVGLVDRRGNLRPAGEWLRRRRAAEIRN